MSDNLNPSSDNPQDGGSPDEAQVQEVPSVAGRASNRRVMGRAWIDALPLLRFSRRAASVPDPSQVLVEFAEEPLVPPDMTVRVARWTLRRDIPIAILAWSGVIFFAFWLASHVTQALLLLVIAAVLAYTFAPLVTLLTRVMPRIVAVLIVYLVVFTGVSFLLYLVARSAVDQVVSLSHSIAILLTPQQPGQLTPLEQFLKPFGISSSQIASARDQLLAQLGGVAKDAFPLLTGIASAALDIVLVIILSIYFLFDGSKVVSWLRRDMPRSQRGRVGFFLTTMQRVVGGYIRGQLIMSTLVGVLVGGGMFLLGVPYALLLGVLAFIFEFIPILGSLLSGAICILLALTKGWVIALIVLVYFIGVHIFEGDIVGPRVLGKAVGLHPIVSIAALIAGGELFGIWGALFASPVAGILQAVIVALWTEWRTSHPDAFGPARQNATRTSATMGADQSLDPAASEKLIS